MSFPVDTGKLTLYIATSLDGYIADPNGGVDWLEPFETEPTPQDPDGYEAFFETVDALVMGSTTYEQILSFGDWPYQEKPAYVLTRRELPLEHEHIERVEGPVEHLAERLRHEHDHVWIVGGSKVARSFLKADELDEIRLTIAPVLLGNGIPLFEDTDTQRRLDLLEAKPFSNGLVELHYSVESN